MKLVSVWLRFNKKLLVLLSILKTECAAVGKLKKGELFESVVSQEREGQRLDQYLVDMLPDMSRSRLGGLIRAGFVLVNGRSSKAASRIKGGDLIAATIPPPEPLDIRPEKIDFTILHEDDDLLVIAKPPGVVVHPACGHQKGTLVHGLVAHCDNLSGISGIERPGIVHRLDKETSGVMVVAKSDRTHHALVDLFRTRQINKVYHAIIVGRPATPEGCILQAIGRHRSNRKKMAVLQHGGRDAVTCWSTMEEFANNMAYLEVKPKTGRTHQIRVHMAYLGHPVAGDSLYGKPLNKVNEHLGIKRQCLHAYSLSFKHPITGQQLEFVAPLWLDMQDVLLRLRALNVSLEK